MTDKHLLVLGAGSVGKRHVQNFASLGCQVSAMDPQASRLEEARQTTPLVNAFTTLATAFDHASQFAGVVVCSPTKFHVEQAVAALERGLPVFLEKPLSIEGESASRLVEAVRESEVPLLLGYSYRWWPPIQQMKDCLEQGMIGKVLHARCIMSAHLADWHPWERYQDFFMANKALGGGALLDESHFLDLLLWFFGMPSEVFAKIERLSSLEIETDDNVDAWLSYPDGLRGWIHLDLYGRPHERSLTLIGEEGSLVWSYEQNRVRLGRSIEQEWEDTPFSCERNDMFLSAAQEFLQVLDEGRAPSCTVEDGYNVMQVIERLRQSAAMGKVVPVG